MADSEPYDDDLIEARSAFKSGGQFQNMIDRQEVTDATHTARVSGYRTDSGDDVDCVTVYLAVEDIPDPLLKVAVHHGLELVDRTAEKLTFIRERESDGSE